MEDNLLKQKIAERWNESSKQYDTHFGHGIKSEEEKQEWLKLFKNIIPKENANVLDVGAGTGFNSLLLAELGHTCRGIDLSEGMLSKAREKAKAAGFENRLTFEIGDAENIDAEDNTYDVIVNRHLLWTLPHPEEAIKEWVRVIKPGGIVIIIDADWKHSSPNRDVRERLQKELDEWRGITAKEDNYYTAEMKDSLPMMSPGSIKRATDIITSLGCSYRIETPEGVEAAEDKVRPIYDLIWRTAKRQIIIVEKK